MIGLVLSGAVAKGAYESGVVSVLAEHPLVFRRLTGTSSGALTTTVLAAGIATGRVALAARILEEAWRDHAAWHDAVAVSPSALLGLQGLSTVGKVRASVRSAIDRVLEASDPGDVRTAYPDVEFRLVGTDLGSTTGVHERCFTFRGRDFATTQGRDRITLATVASAAFPGLFAPVEVDGGFIADGGITNNSAISYLLEDEAVRRVLVVAASAPREAPLTEAPRGVELVARIVDILIDERIARDVRDARRRNDGRRGGEEPEPRPVEIVEIRPHKDLEGTPFSGLFSSTLRAQYIDAGKRRARELLGVIAC